MRDSELNMLITQKTSPLKDTINALKEEIAGLKKHRKLIQGEIKELEEINETLASNNMILKTGFYQLRAENKRLRDALEEIGNEDPAWDGERDEECYQCGYLIGIATETLNENKNERSNK